jgi:tetratricopeptide (TPR) repeat protein
MRWLIVWMTLLCSQSAHAEWRVAQTPHYIIYSEGSEKALRDYAVKIENFSTVLRHRLNAVDDPDLTKLTIFMLPNMASVEKSAKTKNVAGFYATRPGGPYAVTHRDTNSVRGQSFADSTLFHELGHHFMFRYAPGAYPAWLTEGFAEFYSTVVFDKAEIPKVGVPPYARAYDLFGTKAISIEKLLNGSPNFRVADEVGSFYARSWVLTHYLLLPKDRAGQLTRYLQAIQGGSANLDAAQSAFGDLTKLDKDIDAYVNQRKISVLSYQKAFPAPEGITISLLSQAAGAFVPLRLSGFQMHHIEQAESQVKALQAALKPYPGEAEGWRMLAEAELLTEDYAAAETAADAALKIDPKLPGALLAKGWAKLQKADAQTADKPDDWNAARNWIVKANQATPNDPLILTRYYQSFKIEGSPLPKIAGDGLMRAFTLSPEEPNLRMMLALHLSDEKKFDQAIVLITPLVYGAHEDASSSGAAALLARFKRGKAGLPLDEEGGAAP